MKYLTLLACVLAGCSGGSGGGEALEAGGDGPAPVEALGDPDVVAVLGAHLAADAFEVYDHGGPLDNWVRIEVRRIDAPGSALLRAATDGTGHEYTPLCYRWDDVLGAGVMDGTCGGDGMWFETLPSTIWGFPFKAEIDSWTGNPFWEYDPAVIEIRIWLEG